MIPGSYPCAALAAYSFHHSTGADECRKTSLPSWIEGQSDVSSGIRPAPRTSMGRRCEAKSSRASSVALGVFALVTRLVYLLKSAAGGLRAAKTWTAIGSLHAQKGESQAWNVHGVGARSGQTRLR